jgi:hypothetical protein
MEQESPWIESETNALEGCHFQCEWWICQEAIPRAHCRGVWQELRCLGVKLSKLFHNGSKVTSSQKGSLQFLPGSIATATQGYRPEAATSANLDLYGGHGFGQGERTARVLQHGQVREAGSVFCSGKGIWTEGSSRQPCHH